MKKGKKLLAICLAFALFVSMFTVLGTLTVSAVGTEAAGKRDLDSDCTYWYSDTGVSTYTSGTGTAEDPYIITTAAELRHLARGNTAGGGKYYKLGCDIVINDTSAEDWYEGTDLKNWIKGSDGTYGTFSDTRNYRELGGALFRDNFDGDGHTISGLYINYNGTGTMTGFNNTRVYCGWGLFPCVFGATFKNVKLKDVYIKSNLTASAATGDYHGYGALVGNVYGNSVPTTFENVEVENVKFDITKPNLSSAGKPVGVGGIIGYSYGNLTVTDAVVKNVTAKLTNWYATSRCAAYIGAVTGAMGWASVATLNNVITIGSMNPMSCSSATSGGAVSISSGNWIQDVKANLSAGINATNCYAIGAEKVHDGVGITLVADDAAFIGDYLDTFYDNIGASENWAEKQAGVLPTLKDFPYIEEHKTPGAVLRCNFSDYTPSANAKALDNWSIVDEDGNKALKGDFNNTSLAANNFGFIIGTFAYGVHGPLEPGKIYKLEFKAKADKNAAMDYALYNGSTYACSSRDSHVITDGYDEFGRRTAELTTEWQEFSTYFTFDSYTNTVDQYQGVNRPYFFVIPRASVWENALYFDDILITPYSGMSFREEENHYFEPTLGYPGEDVVLTDAGERNGCEFEGWYTDPELSVAFDPDTVKIGDVPVLYAKWVDLDQGLMQDVSIDTYDDDWNIASQLVARRMVWNQEKNAWLLEDGTHRIFTDKTTTHDEAFETEPAPVYVAPQDMSVSKTEGKLLSIRDLNKRIAFFKRTGLAYYTAETNRQSKLAAPFVTLIMCLLGIPFAISTRRKSKILNIIASMVIAFTFWWLISMITSVGENGYINPYLAGWGPVLIFGA
ncbi:MAG: LptF/LptG family permease, partial [Clostridia bacterium]|nr:LptF/LptG family permease [Clostridia bacterium]